MSMFKVVVTEVTNVTDDEQQGIERYRQTVDDLNLRALIAAINTPKRGPRAKNEKPEKK